MPLNPKLDVVRPNYNTTSVRMTKPIEKKKYDKWKQDQEDAERKNHALQVARREAELAAKSKGIKKSPRGTAVKIAP